MIEGRKKRESDREEKLETETETKYREKTEKLQEICKLQATCSS